MRMQELWIAHDTWVLIGDGRKALVLRNVGTPQRPSFEVVDALRDDANPPNREQGADRPGRLMHGMIGKRSAVEQTDWHEIAEDRFATTIASRLADAANQKRFEQIILVAPPATLAALRKQLDGKMRARVAVEIGKDLTNHPLPEITRLLAGA
jgi:protein required for attachment to host cells